MQLPDFETLNDIWNEGDATLAREVFAEDVVVHDIPLGTTHEGVDAFTEWMREVREGFPDFRVETQDVVVGESKLVAQWVATGTHDGPLSIGAEPTGRQADWQGATVYAVADGTVTEAWWYYDMLGILEQLGLVPQELPA
jgi:steroid delta-isomerase-like uncharacterized protein